MRSALRAAMAQLGRRLIFAAIAAGAVIAFIAIAGGTDAQTGQNLAIVPIEVSPSALATTPPQPTVAAGDGSTPEPVRPASRSAPAATKAKVTPKATTATSTPAPSPATRRATAHHQVRPPNSSASTSAASVYRYVGYRDIAAVINPARSAQGWANVSTTAARNDAGCLANQTCSGQVGACGMAPASIGTANTERVYDGRYVDQYGNCREVIVI